jgi:uncharacterized membrane protein required for colicin V production
MIFDIIVAALILLFVIIGYFKGFAHSFLRTIDWILAVVAAYIWSEPLGEFLREHTKIYDGIYDKIAMKFGESLSNAIASLEMLPKVLTDVLSSAGTKVTTQLSENMANTVFGILCFAAIVLAVKILLALIIGFFDRKRDDDGSFIGAVDRLLGLLMGAIKGLIIVFLLLAIAIPAANMFAPDKVQAFYETMQGSYFAHYLYDNNLLLMLIRSFL